MTDNFNRDRVIGLLNKILELELAAVVRYTHYSFMIYGYNRIPIVSWMQGQASEALGHAQEAGEMITTFGEHPSLSIGPLLETHNHDIGAILRESLQIEKEALETYYDLLKETESKNVLLEEYARRMIASEELHTSEVNKMLRNPGDISVFQE